MENHKSSDSDSTSDTSDEDQNDSVAVEVLDRKKRGIAWCAVKDDDELDNARKVFWPPSQSSSSSLPSRVDLRHVRVGNPLYGSKMQLWSMTGHHLAIYPDGTVKGTADDNDLHTFLEIVSADRPGHVKIKGLLTNMYVAMDKKGRLFGEYDPLEESTVFIENFLRSYNTYLSRRYAHLGWYIGIKKSGKIKRGPKTKYGQKAIKFLPRRSRFE